MRSTTGLAGVRVSAVPLVGVSTTLLTETLKDRIDGFAGKVSATRVKLTVAVPPPPPPPPPPPFGRCRVQEEEARAEARTRNNQALLRSIQHPTVRFACVLPSLRRKNAENPLVESSAKREEKA